MFSLPWQNARKQATLGRKACFSSHIEERVHCGREGTVARERSSRSHSSTKIQALQHQCPPGRLHFPPRFHNRTKQCHQVRRKCSNVWTCQVYLTFKPYSHSIWKLCGICYIKSVILTRELFERIYFLTTPVRSHTVISLSFAPEFMSRPWSIYLSFLFSFFPFTMLKFENWAFYRLGKCWATERSSQPHPFLKEYWRWFLVLLFPENEIRMKTTPFLSFLN